MYKIDRKGGEGRGEEGGGQKMYIRKLL